MITVSRWRGRVETCSYFYCDGRDTSLKKLFSLEWFHNTLMSNACDVRKHPGMHQLCSLAREYNCTSTSPRDTVTLWRQNMLRNVTLKTRVLTFPGKAHDLRSAICRRLKLKCHKDLCLSLFSCAVVATTRGLGTISYRDILLHRICWNSCRLLNKHYECVPLFILHSVTDDLIYGPSFRSFL